jgi:hypothetical protein
LLPNLRNLQASDGFEKYVFVDQETLLTIAGHGSAPIHAFGQPVTTEGRFLDYEPVNGVLIPRRIVEVNWPRERCWPKSRSVIVEANTITDLSIFCPVPPTKTPLQDILESSTPNAPIRSASSIRIARSAEPIPKSTRAACSFTSAAAPQRVGEFSRL